MSLDERGDALNTLCLHFTFNSSMLADISLEG